MGTGKCAGNRPPPCGRGENCKGFEKGIRCGAHGPVGKCGGHGVVKKQQKTYLGVPLEQWDPFTQLLVKEGKL